MDNEWKDLLKDLSFEEKSSLCRGVTLFETGGCPRLGIPPLRMSDGPHGVREELLKDRFVSAGRTDDASTYFCTLLALASTWNPALAYRMGQCLGREARARGKDIILGPGVNIIRTPHCGRNFEYLSEDPFLTASFAVPYILGVQEQGVGACVKHYALNNQEKDRKTIGVEVSERALREIYLPAFEAAVKKANVVAVMGAYNRFRGEFCCHNAYLLRTILREEWGFRGIVISDWDGVHDTRRAVLGGLDIEMGTGCDEGWPFEQYWYAKPLLKLVSTGELPPTCMDEKVLHVLHAYHHIGILDPHRPKGTMNTPEHREVSRQIAREAIVLLKNDRGILPLQKDQLKRLVVIGDNAVRIHANGGGSSRIKTPYEVTPLEGIQALVGETVKVEWVPGYIVTPEPAGTSTSVPVPTGLNPTEARMQAIEKARSADGVIFFGGLNHDFDREGADRLDMNLPYQQDLLLQELLRIRPDTVVVLIAGSPVDVSAWNDSCSTLLWTSYGGMEGGHALAEVLFGIVNPSGKLPITFPRNLADSPAHALGEYPGQDTVHYREGILVGYRYFDTEKVEPAFPFGHGLSYIRFRYSSPQLQWQRGKEGVSLEVRCTITNTGGMQGAETVQVYLADRSGKIFKPEKELKGFYKVVLDPGESKEVLIRIPYEEFRYFDEQTNRFRIQPGEYELLLGGSSKDIRISIVTHVTPQWKEAKMIQADE
ncbi:MAG: glycoside hydrolase family 3 C-terminal domain-containing protein [Spirochaetales bacterium]